MRFLMLILFVLLSVSSAQAQDAPPYIHYYDHLHGGLVIERADGTDSRIIPDVPMDAGPPVWSPSGKWMVIGHVIISTNGSERIEMPEPSGAYDTVKPLWSADDMLLTVRDEQATRMTYVQITDPESGTVLAEIEFESGDNYGVELYWDETGSRAFIGWPGRVVTLYRDGRTNIRVEAAGDRQQVGSIFKQGRLFYIEQITDGGLMEVVTDVDGTRRIEIGEPISADPLPWYFVRWSPTLEHILIYARSCSPSGGNCETSLKLVDWQSGSAITISPTVPIAPDDYECPYYFECTELWSPDGRYAIISDPYVEASEMFLLDVATGETRQVAASKNVIYYRWSATGQLYLIYADDPHLHRYDPVEDAEISIEVPVPIQYTRLFPSPDGKLIGVTTNPPTVIDDSGAIAAQTPPHSFSTGALCCPSDYQWDASSKWVMAGYPIYFAGGGHSQTDAAVVFDIEGTVRSDLPYEGHSGFVPERAVPHLASGQPQSAKKEPVLFLPQEGRVQAVGWHPTDPDRLVTYSTDAGLVFWSLAGGTPEVTNQIEVKYPGEQTYQIGGLLYWLPERDTVAIFEGGEMRQFDPQHSYMLSVDDIDYPRLATSDKGQVVRYPLSGETVEIMTTTNLNGLRTVTSDFSGFITGDDVEDTNDHFYVDAESGRVVPLEMPESWFTPYAADARDGIAFLGSIYSCCVAVVSTEDGHLIDQFYGTAYSLAISADGRRLATTSAGMTAIWDTSEYMGEE